MTFALTSLLGHQSMQVVLEGMSLRLSISMKSSYERALVVVHVVVERVGRQLASCSSVGSSSILRFDTCH